MEEGKTYTLRIDFSQYRSGMQTPEATLLIDSVSILFSFFIFFVSICVYTSSLKLMCWWFWWGGGGVRVEGREEGLSISLLLYFFCNYVSENVQYLLMYFLLFVKGRQLNFLFKE